MNTSERIASNAMEVSKLRGCKEELVRLLEQTRNNLVMKIDKWVRTQKGIIEFAAAEVSMSHLTFIEKKIFLIDEQLKFLG